ncbi:MAG: indole-3-glycerol phosphate synthase TrpC [Acidaminococcales bacterium]|jgi:indole-3-glycerol phosphate synthase|nr:indole-3-glycerol phosphate synthase TrpC [Acidaminococcales bacterium]
MLEQIVAKQKLALEKTMRDVPLSSFERRIEKRGGAFGQKIKTSGWTLIAECKLASPAKGALCPGETAPGLARVYEANGAAALSVHTNGHFLGKAQDLAAVRRGTGLPVMRKEFIVHPYQIYETAFLGADALLLIARILERKRLAEFIAEADGLGLDCLVEAHDEADIDKSLEAGAGIIGINNRDLANFATDINVSLRLFPRCAGKPAISESGIKNGKDAALLKGAGFKGILVGEALVTAGDIGQKTREMAL